VTARCLSEDLALTEIDPSRDVRAYSAAHDILRAFVIKREGAPDVGEPTRGIEPFGAYLNLHRGRSRAITYWDAESDVCWLLAFSETHATGEDRECYEYFVSLGERRELLPTADDYETLEAISTASFIDFVVERTSGLYDEARRSPGQELSQVYDGGAVVILVDVMIIEDGEFEEGWASISFPIDTPLNEFTALDIIARFPPDDVTMSSLQHAATFGSETCAETSSSSPGIARSLDHEADASRL
jgi:hypothetical protein